MTDSTTRPAIGQPKDYEEIARAYERQRRYQEQPFNGSTKFVNTMLTVLALLVASAICGEVVVYGQVQVLQSTVTMLVSGKISGRL